MKTIYCMIMLLLIYTLAYSQVNLEINNGMEIETSGSNVVKVSGDVLENGTGYLKGNVSSGVRTSMTSFAGLTLSNNFSGTITRTTGIALSSSSPKTFLRYYKLENSNDAFGSDITIHYLSSGNNDETNGILTPFIYNYDEQETTWTGYPNNSATTSVASAVGTAVPMKTSYFTVSEGLGVAAKIFLEGPYQNGGTISTSIHGSLPSVSPYSEDARTATTIPAGAVDWVLVRLRRTTSTYSIIVSHSAFVNSDGYLIDDAGNLYTEVPGPAAGNYMISIKHRNHLEVMTNTPQSLDWVSN